VLDCAHTLICFSYAAAHKCFQPAAAWYLLFYSVRTYAVASFSPYLTNNSFDRPGANEDFGREQITGDPQDRYKFRTSPLRNVAVQATFMHNGSFTRLEDAVRHHLNVAASARQYTPARQQLAADLSGPAGPIDPVLARIDPILVTPIDPTNEQINQLVAFVRDGLLDPRAKPEHLRRLVPRSVPNGRPVLIFEFAPGK
jgi:cytochrome c peroxidase